MTTRVLPPLTFGLAALVAAEVDLERHDERQREERVELVQGDEH